MTVASQTSRVSYAGNGSTVLFAVPFYFLENGHLRVVLRSSAGVETTQIITTNYTVSGAGNPAGGSITMTAAPPSGSTLVIVRNVPVTQETDYQANDPFPAESHERALDKLTMIAQQSSEFESRALKIPQTESTNTQVPPIPTRASKVLGFDAAGEPVVSTKTVNEIDTAVADIQSLVSTGPQGNALLVQYVPGVTGAVTTNVQSKLREVVSVKDYGAVGNGSTSDQAAFAAGAYVMRHVPKGEYVTTSVNVNGLYGEGEVYVNNHRLYIPKAQSELNPVQKLLQKLFHMNTNRGQIALIGDSISDFYYASSVDKHWFTMLRRNINYLQGNYFNNEGDFELVTNFDDPFRKSFSLGGSYSWGTRGPLKRSLILAAGGYIEFTGAYRYPDVYFYRDTTNGTLEFSHNSTVYKTVDCSGAAEEDFHTTQVSGIGYNFSAPDTSGTHRITAVGGPVEITGLHRITGEYTSPSESQTIRFARVARSGYATSDFDDKDVIASIKKVATIAEPSRLTRRNALYIVAIGTNNMYNNSKATTPEVFFSQLLYILNQLNETGQCVYLMPYKAGSGTVTSDRYENYMSFAKMACDYANVPMINLNAYPIYSPGLFNDAVHPNDNGYKKFFEIICEELGNAIEKINSKDWGTPRYIGGYSYAWGISSGSGWPDVYHGITHGCYWSPRNNAMTTTSPTAILNTHHDNRIDQYVDFEKDIGDVYTPTLRSQISKNGEYAFLNGITFEGVSSSTGLVNAKYVLDDYEEGTFEPTIIGTTSAGVGTYVAETGTYTKIGNRVFFAIYLSWSAHTGTGNMKISGLPFTSSNSGTFPPCAIYNNGVNFGSGKVPSAFIEQNAITIDLSANDSAGGATATVALDTSGTLNLFGSYIV